MFVSFAASRSCHTDFLHVDLSSLVNSKGCNKTRDTWELHLHFWFLFRLFQLYLCLSKNKGRFLQFLSNGKLFIKDQRNKSRKECMLGGRETSAIHKNDFSYLVIRYNKFLFFKKSLLIKFLTVTKLHIVIRSI